MNRFFISKENINLKQKVAVLVGDEFRHAAKTLRLKAGDEIQLIDGEGGLYWALITQETKRSLSLVIKDVEQSKQDRSLSVFIGLPKGKKMDFIVKALTQVGATAIGTFTSEHTVAKVQKEKTDRLEKIASEACKQSDRLFIPKIQSTISFKELLQKVAEAQLSILFYEKSGHYLPLSDYKGNDVLLIIGPEGGFSEQEVNSFKQAGAMVSFLSDGILRVETAAIAATQIARYSQLA